jgi:hypothetical protein
MEILDYINSKALGDQPIRETFFPEDLVQKINASRHAGKVSYAYIGDFWESEDSFIGPVHSLGTILANSLLAGVPGSDAPVGISGSYANGKISFQLTNLDLESRFGTPDDLGAIFSPYATSRTPRRRFDPGVGLHLATSRNLADTEGIYIEAKKDEAGRTNIHITVEVSRVEGA